MKFNLCLITQNEQLARQIIANARSEAFNHVKDVQAGYVKAGDLKDWLPRLCPKTPSCANQVLLSQIAPHFKIIADTSSMLLSNRTGVLTGVRFFQNTLLPALMKHDSKLLSTAAANKSKPTPACGTLCTGQQC